MGLRYVLGLWALLAAHLFPHSEGYADELDARVTHFGVSTFSFGPSSAAIEQTYRAAEELGDIYVVQLDNGVPWAEAAADVRFPAAVERKWLELSAHAPSGRPVYLALAPLAEDRVSLAAASEGSSSAERFRGASFDDPAIVEAYTIYAQRAVRYFKPAYLNLGVENGELAYRRPSEWSSYVGLIRHVMAALRQEFPTLKIGISFGLQSLMDKATAERARQIVDLSDYVGISFYPYMSGFQEKFGLPALPLPPDEWRVPLDWIRSFTDKPIAICETGYNTKDVSLPKWRIRLTGSEAAQKDYLSDLANYAKRDGYIFVIYYLPVDIGPIVDTLPYAARELANMWRENGLLDANLTPKPALDVWKSILAAKYEPHAKDLAATILRSSEAPKDAASPGRDTVIGFERDEDLCQSPSPARVSLVAAGAGAKAMQWEFPAGTQKWTWCARPVPAGGLADSAGMRFRIRSDVDGPVFLEMKAASVDAYFTVVEAGRDWRYVTLRWSDFGAEPNNGSSGNLRPGTITDIVLADEGKVAATEDRPRRIWISDWVAK
jgi:hypothetical protein